MGNVLLSEHHVNHSKLVIVFIHKMENVIISSLKQKLVLMMLLIDFLENIPFVYFIIHRKIYKCILFFVLLLFFLD